MRRSARRRVWWAQQEGLVDRTTARLGAALRLSPAELDSLLAAVRSGLDLSLTALLAERPLEG